MIDRDILFRFFEGAASTAEENAIRNWMDAGEDNKKLFMQERLAYDALLLHNPAKIYKKKRTFSTRLWAYSAAAAMLLLLLVSSLYIGNIINQRNLSKQYNTLIVPPGQRINLILADNSNVWLNANTTLRYPSKFGRKNRMVYLDGEAYFDVSKNKKKPFVVQTHAGNIHVTGTMFNLEAYSKYNSFEASLFEGGVDVYRNNRKIVSLKPNQKTTLKNDKLYLSGITDTDKYLWREGLIAFNNENLEDILASLEKYFDIKINMNAAMLPKHTYTGKFRQSDGVDYALKVLQRSIRFTYERNEETGAIYIQ